MHVELTLSNTEVEQVSAEEAAGMKCDMALKPLFFRGGGKSIATIATLVVKNDQGQVTDRVRLGVRREGKLSFGHEQVSTPTPVKAG